MDYEKKYKEALEKARQLCAYPTTKSFIRDLQDLFPELAEPEDEKVRKALIDFFGKGAKYGGQTNGVYDKDILAWLEKQGEKHQNPYNGISFEYNGHIWGMCARDNGVDISCDKHLIKHLEKQGEQKPAEWSEEDEPQKELAKSYLAKFDEKFPILPTLKGKQLADYKNFLNKCQQIFGLRYWGIRPLQAKLFEKLSLLWAAWGAEHLQGLGQTDGDMDNEISMWSEEDETYSDLVITAIKLYYTDDKGEENPWREELLRWLKSLRPHQQWKPSSEQIGLLQAIINEPKNAASESCQIVLREVLEQLKKLKEE